VDSDSVNLVRILVRQPPLGSKISVCKISYFHQEAVAFRRMVTRLGPAAKMPFGIHPHMLRHSTGFKRANQGVDTRSLQHYLGHKNIQHTVRYSELSPERFRDFWKD
jgi:site-specific recombinase XerD